jgi:hypothetical protein
MEGMAGRSSRANASVSPTATVGFVFSGTAAPVPITSTSFVNSSNYVTYRWDVTVPAGGTAILMHFGLQHDPGDFTGAQNQAQALVNLTDPDALTGMTEAEKAQVVNFTIPPTTGTLRSSPAFFSHTWADSTGWLWDAPHQGPLNGGDCSRVNSPCAQSGDAFSGDIQSGLTSSPQNTALVEADSAAFTRFNRLLAVPDEEK